MRTATATNYWWDRPIRVCPTEWCKCPHREEGDDPRCAECRRRPEGAERHGSTMTRVASLSGERCWNGEFGGCFSTWLEQDDQPRSREDHALVERLASLLTREDCIAFLNWAGEDPPGLDRMTRKELRERAAHCQYRLWWPRRFV